MATYPNDQGNPAGAIPVYLAASVVGGAAYANITTNTNTLVKTGAAAFYGISVNTGGTGATATVYDGTTAGGKLIGTFDVSARGTIMVSVGLALTVGLFIVTAGSGAANLTVIYK